MNQPHYTSPSKYNKKFNISYILSAVEEVRDEVDSQHNHCLDWRRISYNPVFEPKLRRHISSWAEPRLDRSKIPQQIIALLFCYFLSLVVVGQIILHRINQDERTYRDGTQTTAWVTP